MQHHMQWLPGALLGCWLAASCSSAWADETPPRFEVAAPQGSLTFIVYGDTRFTARESVANAPARRALVAAVAGENPAAIFIGGDLVYQGDDPDDYATYASETVAWSARGIPVFPALGNHEFRGCQPERAVSPCLENWWHAFAPLRPCRWYSVAMGSSLLVLVLDSDSSLKSGSAQRTWLERQISDAAGDARVHFILVLLHYPPVRDAVFPRGKDEAQVQRYLSRTAPTLRPRVIVVGSHVHNYERFERDGVTYLVSGGGGAKPLPVLRMSGELSQLRTSVNFHYLRMTLAGETLTGTMVRYEAGAETDAPGAAGSPWSEPDRFEVRSQH
ncbi:MAG TPA: metallophosphoesterase [Steroidobacteraceae bacterium]|nr:metallophosphoesterase [Steroidobacteraceae bacterium]